MFIERLPDLTSSIRPKEFDPANCWNLVKNLRPDRLGLSVRLDVLRCTSIGILPALSSLKNLRAFHAANCRVRGLDGLELLVLLGILGYTSPGRLPESIMLNPDAVVHQPL